MKYWRGYLTAGILFACTWALEAFAKGHSALMDMIYPYMTRLAQSFLADWSSSVDFCLWQMLMLVLAAIAFGTLVLVIVFRRNPIQWFGWVCAVVAAITLLNTGLYSLNEYSGSLAEDIRLEELESGAYNTDQLRMATVYYRDQVNKLAESRTGSGADFDTLAEKGADGFEKLVYGESLAVFAGPMQPVKKLSWASNYTAKGITGVTVGLTGESAVNPETPEVLLPFAICREMARRMSILVPKDASFAAYMACMANPDAQFQYSGALMGYRYCINALETVADTSEIRAGESYTVKQDLLTVDEFLSKGEQEDIHTCDLLTSWHIQEVDLPPSTTDEPAFNPLDKSQVDLSDHPDA